MHEIGGCSYSETKKSDSGFYFSLKAKDFSENIIKVNVFKRYESSEKFSHETAIEYNSRCNTLFER